MPDRVNVARWIPRSRVNGPGERFVVWAQGCGLACPGCWNPDTWDFAPRTLLDVEDLCARILGEQGIEGVTFTGGEPFAQARALAAVARRVRAAGLSVLIFTGHELGELRGRAARALLALADIVVSGRFVLAERDTTLALRGSRNQQVHFLTDRYDPSILDSGGASIELHLDADGAVHATGFPGDDLLRALSVISAEPC